MSGIASPHQPAIIKMGSKKRKLDVDGNPGSDYEPVSESWSKTEQYKVCIALCAHIM